MATLFDDAISDLKFASWRIGARQGPPRYITVHYNGPPTKAYGYPNAEKDQLRFDAQYHMGPYLKADGIQYHIAVLSNGARVLLRPLTDRLWHCGNALGNDRSLAIHVPLGGVQQPTRATLESLRILFDTLRDQFDIHQTNVRCHWHWKATACPGASLGAFTLAYNGATRWIRTNANANVRSAPAAQSAIRYTVPRWTRLPITGIVSGVAFNQNAQYVVLADGSGFIHSSIVQAT